VTPARGSAFFFGSVAKYPTGGAYASALSGLSADQIEKELAEQAWELSRIAERKYRRARHGYYLVLLFLLAWAVARVALSLAG